jgi:hypothetical protein
MRPSLRRDRISDITRSGTDPQVISCVLLARSHDTVQKIARDKTQGEQSAGESQLERNWRSDNNELGVAAYREYNVYRKISVT